jgi:O-antigen ligase
MTSVAYAALWFFVFSVPWGRLLVLPGLASFAQATGGLALGLTVLAVVMAGRVRRLHLVHVAALLFWTWAGFQLFLFHFGERVPYKFLTYGQLLLMLWMMWELAPSVERQLGLMTALVLGAYVSVIETFRLYFHAAGTLRRYAAGGFDANDLAMMLALAIPMAWYLGTTHRRPILRWICRAYVPLSVAALGLTGSRGGMIASTMALLFVPLSITRLTPGRLLTSFTMLVAAGVLAVVYVPDTSIQRLASAGTEIEAARFGGRAKIWRAGLKVLPANPILGAGVGSFKTAVTPVLGPTPQAAHNSYLSVLVEQGIVGFTFFMLMLVAPVPSVLKLPTLERRLCLVLMGTLALAMFPLTWEDRRPVWVTLGILIGFSHAVIAARRAAAVRPALVGTAPAEIHHRESRRRELPAARRPARWESRCNDLLSEPRRLEAVPGVDPTSRSAPAALPAQPAERAARRRRRSSSAGERAGDTSRPAAVARSAAEPGPDDPRGCRHGIGQDERGAHLAGRGSRRHPI